MSTLVGFAHQGETIRTRDAQAIVDEQDTGIADAAGLPVVAQREAWIVSKEKLALHASPDTLERVVVERENKVSERLKAAWVMSLMDAVTALEGFDPTRVLDLGERVVGEATPVHRVAVQRLIVRATDVDGMGQGEPNDGSIRFALGPLDQVLLATRDSVGNQVSEPVETTL